MDFDTEVSINADLDLSETIQLLHMVSPSPLCSFFVPLQLALSPPLPAAGQHVSLNPNTHLTLKVEGVVEHSGCGNTSKSNTLPS